MPAKNLKPSARRPEPSSAKKKPGIKVKVIVHEAEEGGFWAEVPALPGCFTQGETRAELLANLRDAIEGAAARAISFCRTSRIVEKSVAPVMV